MDDHPATIIPHRYHVVKNSKIQLFRPLEIMTTPLLRSAFASPICFSKVSDKMPHANSVDPVLIRVYTICHSTKYFKKQLHKSKTLAKILLKSLGHLLYFIFPIRTTPLKRPLLDSPKSGLNP